MRVTHRERCPNCAALGKDRSSDNLAVYEDSHKWCYSCGYFVPASGIARVKKNTVIKQEVTLPADSCYDYPQRALTWIEQYELTRNDLLANRVLWSEYRQRLIFPVFDETGLLAYQGRYFGTDKSEPKWFGKGDLKNILHVIGSGDILVCTEDIISAIKVGRDSHQAMPLFGCVIGYNRFKRIKTIADRVVVWLDPDKRKEAIVESNRGNLMGLDTRVIFSERDPKEHSFQEIKEYLTT